MLKKILQFSLRHKIAVGILVLAAIGGGYFGYMKIFSDDNAVRYLIAKVQKGTIVVSVAGTGQVSVSNQANIKPKASGDIIYIGVKNGQEIKAGALIAQIDARDAQKAVRDAEANLKSAELSLEKLRKPADVLSLLQAENSLVQAEESRQNAEENLTKSYEAGFNAVANGFLDFPTIMSGLDDLLFDSAIEKSQWNIDWYYNQVGVWDTDGKAARYKDDVNKNYNKARQIYNASFELYKAASRTSESSVLETLISETYETAKLISDAVKSSSNYIDLTQDIMKQHDVAVPAAVTSHQSALNGYTGKINSHLINLLTAKQGIEDYKKAIVNAVRSIAEKTESLAELKTGPDALDIQSQELSVKQRQNSLLDAKEKLADYFIRAPFDGVIAKIDIEKGDSVSAGAVVATLITKQRLAEISFNEIDAAKIKVGQKATLSFDAIPDLSISGEVAEIEVVGTISQGVVSYIAKITFDTQDERVKPGMSISANIITEAKTDVLFVPNSAVKTQGDDYYVEAPAEQDLSLLKSVGSGAVSLSQSPARQPVEVDIANDDSTEIISGLREGDFVLVGVINSQTAVGNNGVKSGQQGNSSFRIPGMPGR